MSKKEEQLRDKIKEYHALKLEGNIIEAKLKKLNNEIKEELGDNNSFQVNDNLAYKVSVSETEVPNKPMLLEVLRGIDKKRYIKRVEEINEDNLNEDILEDRIDKSLLANCFTPKIVKTLKEVKVETKKQNIINFSRD